ncbi:MAG: recombinase family protein [Agrobacterium sp.]|nr:recombinase family protein [Agrobacterium sp.]
MTKNVLFYARYSTERQNEVSIETQIELGRAFIQSRGWKLIEVFTDHAVSGTSYTKRRGIQALLARAKKRDIDIVLCVTVDRISRDAEHGNGFLKRLKFEDIELWTVHGGTAVTDIEMGLRVTLSQELIEQIRYRTREGMKTAVRKGKATTCLAYGYRVKLEYDGNGDRIPGLREVNEEQAEIVRWIFEQYALGRSPKELAFDLNNRAPVLPGPRGLKWRDTAIRGHRDRGAGILNNETYVGRLVFNRRNFRKNPETENREARMNDKSEWVVGEVPALRIVSDELWAKVKKRQLEVEASFSHTTTNRLNRTHRPSYLLSGLLECQHCSGPYAIMAKDRYGCTNRQKKLPIEHQGNIVCTNSKTISRHELESRILDAIPARLLSVESTASIQDEINRQLSATSKGGERNEAKLRANLREISHKQDVVAGQITQRIMNGQPQIEAFNKMLDDLQKQREELEASLAKTTRKRKGPPKTFVVNPSMYSAAIDALTAMVRTGVSEHDDVQRHFNFVRQLVQKVVIAPSADGKSADLTIHGHLAAVLASMQAFQEYSAGLTERHRNDFARRVRAGEFNDQSEKLAYLERFRAVLAEAEADWKLLQVSVVAGAGFEPAAFRL